MRLVRWGLLPFLIATNVFAIHESDVGVVDWHQKNIGIPRTSTPSTAPVLHRVGQKNTKTVVLTTTDANVLAALSPTDGSIAWRHLYQPDDVVYAFQPYDDVVASLSGLTTNTLRLFDVLNGELIFEKRLPGLPLPSAPGLHTSPLTFAGDSGLIVLADAGTVHSTSVKGEIQWTWSSPDQGSSTLYTKVAATPDAIYVVGVTKSFMTYSLHVTALSPRTGEVLADTPISSSLSSQFADVIVLTSKEPSVAPQVAWIETGTTLKSFELTPALDAKPVSFEGPGFKITEVGLNAHGYFVLENEDSSSRVIQLTSNGLETKWEWEASFESLYSGGLDKERKPYLCKYYWSTNYKLHSIELLAPHLGDGKGLVAGYSFRSDKAAYGDVVHIAMDAANPNPMSVLGRLFFTTSTGALQFMQQDKLQWTREEALSNVELVEFVELPETRVTDTRELEKETFVHRLIRQTRDAQDLPKYLVKFVKRFATGSYASASSSATASSRDSILTRDAFGFRQIIVAVTKQGKVFGLDSSNGHTLWSRRLAGEGVVPVKLFVTHTVSDGDVPQVVLVAQDGEDIVVYHIDALMGGSMVEEQMDRRLHGVKVASGQVANAYLVDKVVLVLDNTLRAHTYPATEDARQTIKSALKTTHLPLLRDDQLGGYQFDADSFSASTPTWAFASAASSSQLIPTIQGPIASLGKVLGNRTTLYKYLNPRLTVLLATTPATPAASASCELQVVDGSKGTVVYDVSIPGAPCDDVKATMTANRLVYGYYDEDYRGTAQSKGYRVVVVEMYEGAGPDDKRKSSDLTAFSDDNLDISVYESSFVYKNEISAMTTTQTKFGITGKDIIVATNDHKIRSIPNRLLNPRRPNRKATTPEMEEGLVQYHPVLPADPKLTLSHTYVVARITALRTVPSLLESTSLVFARGLDLFLTRVAPSRTFDVLSEGFNKLQLVLTIGALGVAIAVTRPMVRRKRLREKWY